MKEATLKKVNTLVINYLSIMGLWGDKHLEQNNPVVMYFMTNVLLNRPLTVPTEPEPIIIGDSIDTSEFLTMNIAPSFFHVIVKELYNVYEKLDDINKNQNSEVKEVLTNFLGSEYSFNEYIDTIMQQYKDSFYELAKHYNSYNPEYNSIRIKVLGDKMTECIRIEDYLEAAKIRNKINSIKEKGK